MALPQYSTGTVAVAAGGTVVTSLGGMWSGINVKQGDFISIAGLAEVLITEVTDATHLKIAPWQGPAQTSAPYVIYQNYVGRVVGVAAAEDVGVMLEKLHVDGLPFIVGPEEVVPDPSYGDDGQMAFQPTTGTWWTKIGGVWVPSAFMGGGAPPPIFTFEGDSLSEITNGFGIWPTLLKNYSAYFGRGTAHYFALSADTAANMVGEYPSQAGSVAIAPGQEAFLFLWAGTNDLVITGASGATIYGYLKSIWAAARTSGYKVVAFCLPPNQTNATAAPAAEKTALNKLILSDPSLYDFVVRLDLALPIVKPNSALSPDGTHFTPLGNAVIAQEVAKTLLGVGAASSAPFAAMASENIFTNGDFTVSQLNGSGYVGLSSGVASHICDGAIAAYLSATGVLQSARIDAAPLGSGALPGLSGYHQILAATGVTGLANGNYVLHRYPIEGFRTAKLSWGSTGLSYAQPLTYAFMFLAQVAGTLLVRIFNSAQTRVIYKEFTIVSGWNFITATIPGDALTSEVWNTTNGVGLYFDVIVAGAAATPVAVLDTWTTTFAYKSTNSTNFLTANSSSTVVAGLFLCAGAAPITPSNLPLLMRPYAEALHLCRRYFQVLPMNVQAGSAGQFAALWPFLEQMRATPTALNISPGTVASVTVNSEFGDGSQFGGYFQYTTSVAGGFLISRRTTFDARLA
jgi:hypothetical protein